MEWKLSPRATICSAIGAWLLAIFLEKTGVITPEIAWTIVGLASLLFIPAIAELCGFKSSKTSLQTTSPLRIDFPGEHSCSEFIEEPTKVFQGTVSRKIVYVNIENKSDHDVRNVRAQIDSFRTVTDSGAEKPHLIAGDKIFPLKFQEKKPELDFSPHMNVRLNLISYARHFLESFVRIEGLDPEARSHQILHESKPWKFTVKVTADGYMPVQRDFMASVDGGGLLVSACDSK